MYENIFEFPIFAVYFPHSNQANSEVLLVLLLACLNLDFTLLFSVLKFDISKGISLSEQHCVSGFCFGEVGQGHAARLVSGSLHLNSLHMVVGLIWGLVQVLHNDGALSHFLPRQRMALKTFHNELLVCVIESSLVLLGEQWAALLIAPELQARYLFDVRHALW